IQCEARAIQIKCTSLLELRVAIRSARAVAAGAVRARRERVPLVRRGGRAQVAALLVGRRVEAREEVERVARLLAHRDLEAVVAPCVDPSRPAVVARPAAALASRGIAARALDLVARVRVHAVDLVLVRRLLALGEALVLRADGDE